MPGSFVVVEGPDGAGKTTLVTALAQHLQDEGYGVVQVREPGGTPSAEILRDLILHHDDHAWTDAAELFLILAARAELVDAVIRPAVRDGEVVVSDRYGLSTIAYQVIGRGLPREWVEAALRLATGGIEPDVTIVLDVDAHVGRARQNAQGKAPDRIESAAQELHERVAAFYAEVVGPGVVHVDANRAPDAVTEEAWDIVRRYLAEHHSPKQG